MPRLKNRLPPNGLDKLGLGKHADGAGLYLFKTDDRRASWVYRYSKLGKQIEMGLGPFPKLSLKQARVVRDRYEAMRAAGKDPKIEREAERLADTRGGTLLREVTARAFEAKKAELREDGKAGRWLSPIK